MRTCRPILAAALLAGCAGPPAPPLPRAWQSGTVTAWSLFGPLRSFEEEDYLSPFDIPEEEVDPLQGRPGAGAASWKPAAAGDGTVALEAGGDTAAYLFTPVQRKEAGTALLLFRARAGVQVWLNGKTVYHDPQVYQLPRWGEHALAVPMRAGTNALLVKAVAREQWRFSLRILEPEPPFLYVDASNLLLPDALAGEALDGWGSVMVANASDRPSPGWRLKLAGAFLDSPEAPQAPLEPHERRRFVFPCRSRGPLPAGKPLEARLEFRGPSPLALPVALAVKDPPGPLTLTYRSALDGSVQPVTLLLPTRPDPGKAWPLLLTLHGANVDDRFQAGGYTPKPDFLIGALYGRGSNRTREAAGVDLDEGLAELARRYPVDPDRIMLAGHSQGGYGTWLNGVRTPDRFAALAPSSAVADYVVRRRSRVGNRSAEAWRLDQRLFRETRPLPFLESLLHLPVFCIHGGGDQGVPPDNARRPVERLKALGYAVRYHEAPGQGHWWGERPGGGADCVDLPELFDFLRERRREAAPAKVRFRTASLRWNRADWARIDRMADPSLDAEVRAEDLKGNRLRLALENVSRLTLDLARFDRGKALAVEGEGVAGRIPAPLPPAATWDAGAGWGPAGEEGGEALEKTHARFGPFSDLFNGPFLIAYGTEGTPQETEVNRRQAFIEAYRWQVLYHGQARVLPDAAVTEAMLHTHHLLCFGNTGNHALLRRAASHLPFRFEAEGLDWGGRRLAGKDLAVRMVAPSPWDPARYLGICGAVSPEGMEQVHRPEAELPDYIVFDRELARKGWGALRAAGFFDRSWKLSSEGEFFLKP